MSDGMGMLDQRISEFEALLQEMRNETQEAHSTLKQIRLVKRDIEKILSTDVKKMVEEEASKIVRGELDKLAPALKAESGKIYEKVGKEVDKLISLCLGKEFSRRHGQEDLRPVLAGHLRALIQQIIIEEGA